MHPPAEQSVDAFLLRKIFAELLRSDSDLDAFCLDSFRDVYRRFTNNMDRTQKENLLLIHAPTLEDIITELKKRFPHATVWEVSNFEEIKNTHANRTSHKHRSRIHIKVAVSAIIIAFAILLIWLLLSFSFFAKNGANVKASMTTASDCNALSIDDVFLAKSIRLPPQHQLVLDVRIRHTGSTPGVINITRSVIELINKTEDEGFLQYLPRHPHSPIYIFASPDIKKIKLNPLERLPDTKRIENILVAQGFLTGQTKILIDHDPQPSVLHIATHGMFPNDASLYPPGPCRVDHKGTFGEQPISLPKPAESIALAYSNQPIPGYQAASELSIPLTGHRLLTLKDLLLASNAPRSVFLLACNAGQDPNSIDHGLGRMLNQADILLKNFGNEDPVEFAEWMPEASSVPYITISGIRNETAMAKHIASGKTDRVQLRIIFTDESAIQHYYARLQLRYNGVCHAEYASISFSK